MERSGAKTIVKEMVDGEALPVRPEDPEIEQMTLFDNFDVKNSSFNPFSFAAEVRKAGRPKGSKNKSTIANKEYCARRGYSNALDLIAVEAMMDPLEVKKRLGCSIEAAMSWVREFRFEYAEYTEKKMPKAVELDSNGMPSIFVANFQTPDLSKVDAIEASFSQMGVAK